MKDLRGVILTLSQDADQLRAFLRDKVAWTSVCAKHLTDEDRRELLRVGDDLRTFLEVRSRQKLERSPEVRYVKRNEIARRLFIFRAASATLATMLPLFCSQTVFGSDTIGAETQGETRGTDATVLCWDSGCENSPCQNQGSYCLNNHGCMDDECYNSAGCPDNSTCLDSGCDNFLDYCYDVSCDDGQCDNDKQCDDSPCVDMPSCVNTRICGDDGFCIDSGCKNDECRDEDGCRDEGCTNYDDCTNDPGCVADSGCSNLRTCPS